MFAEYPDEPSEAVAIATRRPRSSSRGAGVGDRDPVPDQRTVGESRAGADRGRNPVPGTGGESFFTRTEVRQAMRGLTEAARRDDLPPDADVPTLTRAVLAPLGLEPEEPSGAQARDRWESLRAMAALVDDLAAAQPDLTLRDVVTELSARAQARHPPTVQGVTLSSLHAAKGLEWDAVFLVGLTDGSLPISQAVNAGFGAIEEERRLFYVGVTRAREHLQVSWALACNEGRRARRRSRFVTDDIVPDTSPASRIAAPPRCAAARRAGSAAPAWSARRRPCSAAANVARPTSTRNCSPRAQAVAHRSRRGQGCAGLHGPERQDAHRDRRTGPATPGVAQDPRHRPEEARRLRRRYRQDRRKKPQVKIGCAVFDRPLLWSARHGRVSCVPHRVRLAQEISSLPI